MRIGNREIGIDTPPYVIAELGVNHDGSVEQALRLVDSAFRARADAVKLQYFEADRLLGRAARLAVYQKDAGQDDPMAMLRSLELPIGQLQRVVARAHDLGVHAIVTVFSVELVQLAAELPWDAFKTASPDLINRPLIESLMSQGKPLLVSAGASSLDEVQLATSWLDDYPHVMFQCVSSYPTPESCAALAGRQAMMSVNPRSLGYSDHTAAIDVGALAVASGATVLEKHLTHNRSARGPDHAASLDEAGFAEYVRLAHRAFAMLGRTEKVTQPIESDVRAVSRQSITTTRFLPAGHRLGRDDVTIKRPGDGIPPYNLHMVMGRQLSRPVEADTPLQPGDLA